MKVLLINPPAGIPSKPDIPPLGLAYLAGVLRAEGIEVKLLDLDLERERISELGGLLQEFRPDIVGFGGLTLQIENAFRLAREVKCVLPTAQVVIGGPHASSLPERTLQEGNGNLDVVVIGEGEYTLLNLARGMPLNEIDGICFYDQGSVRQTPAAKAISDLDKLPLPARDLLPMRKYRGWGPLRKRPTTHLIASRGCPYECVYCSEKAVFGRGHRRRSAVKVVDEIEHLCRQYGMREVSFYDDLFTLNKRFVLDVCAEMGKRNLILDWKALSRVDTVDAELLTAMRQAGCWMISYGFESGSQRILDNIRKRQTVAASREAAQLTRAAGIRFFGFFMIGNVGETEDTIFDTIRLARSIRPDFWQFTITRPDPGSFLFKSFAEEIHQSLSSWDDYFAFAQKESRMPAVGTDVPMEKLLGYKEFAYMSMSVPNFWHRLLGHLLSCRFERVRQILKWTSRVRKNENPICL